jgi:hypothetical protein
MSKYQSKYIAFVVGAGEGCDYTMGCNRSLFEIVAETDDQAHKGLFELLFGEWCEDRKCWVSSGLHNPDNRVGEVYLFKVDSCSGNIISEMLQTKDIFDNSEKEQIETIRRHKSEEAERLEYERLKAKFGEQ